MKTNNASIKVINIYAYFIIIIYDLFNFFFFCKINDIKLFHKKSFISYT